MTKQFSLSELAKLTKADLVGNPNHKIANVDSLKSALEQDASFLANLRYKEMMKESNAGVICVDKNTELIDGKNFLISENPSKTFQQIAEIIISEIHQLIHTIL